MNIFLGLLVFCVTLFVHETGHYIAAKVQGISVDGFGFRIKPFPHLYVAVIDRDINIKKRLIFLFSGSILVIILFIIFMISGIHYPQIYYIIALQIIMDTNPFYSDYVVAAISYICHTRIRRDLSKEINILLVRDRYMYGPMWYLHLVIWGFIILMLLSPNFFNPYL